MRMRRAQRNRESGGFTLLELLVVMGLLILLAVLTGIGVNRLSNQARVSTGVNQVLAALGNARAYAIQNNIPTMLSFVVKVDPSRLSEPERIEMILVVPTGYIDQGSDAYSIQVFKPVAGMKALELPRGIKVAGNLGGSLYVSDVDAELASEGLSADSAWVTQPGGKWRIQGGVPHTDEIGRQIGVMFAPDGSMITRTMTSASAGQRMFPVIDFDGDYDPDAPNPVLGGETYNDLDNQSPWQWRFTGYNDIGDELDFFPCQFLAVYDDEEARKALGDTGWTGYSGDFQRIVDISRWVNEYGTPIHFNRYTGVAEVDRP